MKSVNDRDLSLLNGAKCDPYLITSWRDFVCFTQGSLLDAFRCSASFDRAGDQLSAVNPTSLQTAQGLIF